MNNFILRYVFKRRERSIIARALDRYFNDVENKKVFLDDLQTHDELKIIKKIKNKLNSKLNNPSF